MAYPPNGERFRRRLSAKTAAKPYDRPPTAPRGVRGEGLVTGKRGGWMSMILDPASRFISNGSAKLFAFLFSKRLTSPLEPVEGLHSEADEAGISQDNSTIPLSETGNGEIYYGGSSIDNQKNSYDHDFVELEMLCKRRKFTMVEFNRLEGLIRSRTVESSNAGNKNNIDRKGKSVMFASDLPGSSKGKSVMFASDLPGSSKVGIIQQVPSNNLASQNPISEASTPAEFAKAYLGLKPSKDSSLSVSLQDQVLNEERILKSLTYAPRRLGLSDAPRSIIRSSRIPEQRQFQNNAEKISRPIGRFAMYRMSRSPYFNVKCAASPKVGEISKVGHFSPISSQWTPNLMKSCGKQAFKRGITVLDDEYGSLGFTRRIRQKSNLVFPSHIYNSSLLTQKYLYLEEKKHDSTSSKSAIDGMEKNSIVLPVQSHEKSHKLLQQLDKLLPSSPKAKSSKTNFFVINGPPSKLTMDMLNTRALKSMEDIKSFNFLSTEEAGKTATPSARENVDEESSLPQNSAYSGIKSMETSQANGVSNTAIPSKNVTKPVPITEKYSASSYVPLSISNKPAFRICVPEESFDLDDDEDDDTNEISIPSNSSPSDPITKISVRNDSSSKTSTEKLFSSSMLSRKDDRKAALLPVLTGNDGFSFPVASDPPTQSQSPPAPTMATSTFKTQKETAPKPVAGSESENVQLSATNIVNSSSGNAGIKVGEEIRSEAIQTTSSSITTNSANESTLVKSEAGKMGEMYSDHLLLFLRSQQCLLPPYFILGPLLFPTLSTVE